MPSAQAEGHALVADDDVRNTTSTENEPLLGRPGDAIQKPDAPIVNNLYLGKFACFPSDTPLPPNN